MNIVTKILTDLKSDEQKIKRVEEINFTLNEISITKDYLIDTYQTLQKSIGGDCAVELVEKRQCFEKDYIRQMSSFKNKERKLENEKEYIEKAIYGIYENNYENRKLGRVGQKYKKESFNINDLTSKINKFKKDKSNKREPNLSEFVSNILPDKYLKKYKNLYELSSSVGIGVSVEDNSLPYGLVASWYANSIQIDPNKIKNNIENWDEFVEVINHEAIHGLISRGISYDRYDLHKELKPIWNKIKDNFDSASEEVKDIIAYIEDTSKEFKVENSEGDKTADLEELVTYAFTNKEFAKFLQNIPSSVENITEKGSIFTELKSIIKNFFKKITTPSSLDEVNEVLEKYFDVDWNVKSFKERNEKYNWGYKFKIKEHKTTSKNDSKQFRETKTDNLSKSIDTVKTFYKQRKITLDTYNDILKSITKKKVTEYADVCVLNNKGELLLLKRSNYDTTNAGAWVIPGGHIDLGEDEETAAKRELLEESGISVDNLMLNSNPFKPVWNKVGEYKDDNCHIHYFCLQGLDMNDFEILLQEEEMRDYIWVNRMELDSYEMIFNMKDNVKKVLNWEEYPQLQIIKKAVNLGLLSEDVLEKALNHKYIRKESDGKGGWDYIYKEENSNKTITENKNLGHSGKFISKVSTNPAQVYKGVKNYLDSIGLKYTSNESKTTSSNYIETSDKFGNDFKIRIANHSPAINDESEWKGLKVVTYKDGSLNIDIDSSIGYKTEDIKNIIILSSILSEDFKNKDLKLKPEEIYNSNIDTIIDNKIKDLGFEDDYYGLTREIIKDKINDFKRSDKYNDYIKEKTKKDSEGKLNEKFEINNIKIDIRDNWVNNVDVSQFPLLLGKENKEKRKVLKDYIQYDLGNKLKNDKISPKEFKEQVDEIISEYNTKDLIKKAVEQGIIPLNKVSDIMKAMKGVYENTLENRKLNRVGQNFDYTNKKEELLDTIEFNGKIVPTKNSKNQYIANTEEKIRNFYKWFGDSKVVDNGGKPLVVYHSTTNDFDTFKEEKYQASKYFFTDNTEYANKRLEERYKYDKQFKNSPLTLRESKLSILPVYLKIEKLEHLSEDIDNYSVDEYTSFMFDKNLPLPDGLYGKEVGTKKEYSWVVFDNKNIKSAIGNDGDFDINNADITKSTNTLKGGKADNMSLEDIIDYWHKKEGGGSYSDWEDINTIARKGYEIGLKIEKEHTDSEEKAAEITLDHLKEDYQYYSKAKPKNWGEKEEEEQDKLEKSMDLISNLYIMDLISDELYDKAEKNYIEKSKGFYKYKTKEWKDNKWNYDYGDNKDRVKSLKEILNKIEKEIVKLPYEHGYCVDEKGIEIFNHTDYSPERLDLDKYIRLDLLKNNILTHNHPLDDDEKENKFYKEFGSTISIQDIKAACSNNLKEIRVASGEYSYSIYMRDGSNLNMNIYKTLNLKNRRKRLEKIFLNSGVVKDLDLLKIKVDEALYLSLYGLGIMFKKEKL